MKLDARKRLWAASALPVLGLLLLIVRAQLIVSTGTTWRLPIEGYDPRDLLSGHYLTFRYAFEKDQPAHCLPGRSFSCCVCFREGPEGRVNPTALWMDSCPVEVQRTCDSFVPAETVASLHRYYVPEHAGASLEAKVREKKASIELTVRHDGNAVITGLHVDESN